MTIALRGAFFFAALMEMVADGLWDALAYGEAIAIKAKDLVLMMATFVVNGGLAITTNRILGGGTEPKFVAWGTGAGTTAKTDTTLFTEAAEARTSGASTQQTTTTTNDTYQVVGTITSLSVQTITNAGLFDAAAAGNLYLKGDFSGLPLSIGDSIQFTFKAQYTN